MAVTHTHHEKVYVAVGNNLQEGLTTLEWAIKKKWSSSNSISIVILHANSSISKDLINTPFGKLPVSAVNEEKLEFLRKCEEEKTDRMLLKFVGFCGKVRAEIQKIERNEQPIQKVMLELIMELHITKLVMAISFLRPSSGKSKSAISGSFYLHRNKPDFCQVYTLCGGKQLFLREGDQQDEQMEEDFQGEMMVERLKQRPNFKGWLGKVFPSGKTGPDSSSSAYSPSLSSPLPSSNEFELLESQTLQWKMCYQEIEEYFQQLSQENGDNKHVVEEESLCSKNTTEPELMSFGKINEDNLEIIRKQIQEAKRVIQLNKDEVKTELDRQAKASWAITLCNQRAEELQSTINEEISARIDLSKETEDAKEQIYEAMADIQETKIKLTSLLELQCDLSSKLQVSTSAKTRAEALLESAANERADLVKEIEEMRKKKGILQRRMEFCKEKDAIGMAMARKVDGGCVAKCREFSAEEVNLATDKFCDERRVKVGGEWSNVYKGRFNQSSIAVKLLDLVSTEVFMAKVNLLKNIRHPNIVPLLGYCLSPRCLVFEYLPSGSLRDLLFSRTQSARLQWQHRVHIAADIISAISFLHSAQPKPIAHPNLNPSNILLDNNLVPKLNSHNLTTNLSSQVDAHAFGLVLFQLLCGQNWAAAITQEAFEFGALDQTAGHWPADLVEGIFGIAKKCLLESSDASLNSAGKALGLLKKKTDGLMPRESEVRGEMLEEDVPSIFLCPIYKGVMMNPYIAADGYSYELEAIEEWLQTGHETSFVTKTRLEHRLLMPNHTLRALIEEWRTQNSDLV